MSAPLVSARLLAPVLQVARLNQQPAQSLLARFGLTAEDINDDQAQVPLVTFCGLLIELSQRLEQPHVGLQVGEATQPRMLGSLGFAMTTAKDLAQAYRCFTHYLPTLIEGLRFEFATPAQDCLLSWHFDEPLADDARRCFDDWLMSCLNNWPRWLTGIQIPMLELTSTGPTPADYPRYRQFFAAELRFEAQVGSLRFPARYLQRPCLEAHEQMHRLHCDYADELLAQAQHAALPLKVKTLIRRHLTEHREVLRREEIAAQLNLSLRSLQRKLGQHGTSFQALYDKARQTQAEQLIATTRITLGELSYQLGFANQSAFQKAFKRWTGQSPSDYRLRLQPQTPQPSTPQTGAPPVVLSELVPADGMGAEQFLSTALRLSDLLDALHQRGERRPLLSAGSIPVNQEGTVTRLRLRRPCIASRLDNGSRAAAAAAPLITSPKPAPQTGADRARKTADQAATASEAGAKESATSEESRQQDYLNLLGLLRGLLEGRSASGNGKRPLRPQEQHLWRLLDFEALQLQHSLIGLRHLLNISRQRLQHNQPLAELDTDLGDPEAILQLSLPLYGRAQPLAELESWLAGDTPICVVEGPAGAGTSCLLRRFRRRCVTLNAPLVETRFDETDAQPWQGLRRLFRGLLGSGLEEDQAPNRLLNTLAQEPGVDHQCLSAFLPTFGKRPRPSRPETEATGQQTAPPVTLQQLDTTLQALLRALSRRVPGLTLCLDGLDRADPDSLKLVANLIDAARALPLRWILSWRSETPTAALLEPPDHGAATDTPPQYTRIRLASLEAKAISQMLAELLPDQPIAQALVLSKTLSHCNGLPGDILAYWQSLSQQGLIGFDTQQRRWAWRSELDGEEGKNGKNTLAPGARQQSEPDEDPISWTRLPVNTQQLLGIAASLGRSFTLDRLAACSAQPQAVCALQLWPAEQSGLVVAQNTSAAPAQQQYRFLLAQSQQWFRDRLPDNIRNPIEWQVGWQLIDAGSAPGEAPPAHLFTALKYLNRATSEASPEQRRRLVELNRQAARHARSQSAFAVACQYLRSACALASTEMRVTQTEAQGELWLERLEAECLAGESQTALRLAEALAKRLSSALQRARLHRLVARQLHHDGNFDDALLALKQGLEALGCQLPAADQLESTLYGMLDQLSASAATPIETTAKIPNLPPTTDLLEQQQRALLQDTAQLGRLTGNSALEAWALTRLTERSLSHGLDSSSPYAFAGFAYLNSWRLGRTANARQYAKVSLDLCKRPAYAATQASTLLTLATQVAPWQDSPTTMLEHLERGHREAMQRGDWLNAGLCLLEKDSLLLYQGSPLGEHLQRGAHNHALLAQLGLPEVANLYQQSLLRGMRELCAAPPPAERPVATPYAQAWLLTHRIANAYLLDQSESWLTMIAQEAALESALAGHYRLPESLFYGGLMRARLFEHAQAAQRQTWRLELNRLATRLELWRQQQPQNFTHLHALIAAECAALEDRPQIAMQHYEEALESAAAHRQKVHQAVAAQAYSRFWARQGRHRFARLFQDDALGLYEAWNAHALVTRLARQSP